AQAGLGSRRTCEELISQGRVEVDGRTIREQGVRVDPNTAVIRVDGQRISVAPGMVYLAMNKPLGVVSAMSDKSGRRCVGDLVADRDERLFHVGRLDTDTEGLLLLTNDGELAHRLAHPSYAVPKVYLAEVEGRLDREALRELRLGVTLDDGRAVADEVSVVQQLAERTLVELTVHEGRNRIVRRMFDSVGHPVRRLVRLQVGPIRLGPLKPGHVRSLRREELADLFALISL
ncbi:MAG: pseudouridine synthase, partial [Actinomycetes bacterium]